MQKFLPLLLLVLTLVSCGGNSDDVVQTNTPEEAEKVFEWTIPETLINGSDSPFPLANDPNLQRVRDVEFLADETLVAAVNIDGTVKIYPYVYLNNFESVNDKINDKSFAITYCPLTQSALLVNRKFQTDEFILRASGYLLFDNVILIDQKTGNYWSQMLAQCIKGPYAGSSSDNFNFIEITWETVKANFPEAEVFTNASVPQPNATANKANVKVGDLVYGILGASRGQPSFAPDAAKPTRVHIYHYDDFGTNTTLKTPNIAGKKTLVIGNRKDHYITSYLNDSDAIFEAVQNRFPIVMKDDDNNEWDVFGIAVSGPRKGDQLDSPTGFFALFWAWQNFYEDFIFDE